MPCQFFTDLSAAKKSMQLKIINDKAKLQIISEKLTPFGSIFPIMEQFDSAMSSVIWLIFMRFEQVPYIPNWQLLCLINSERHYPHPVIQIKRRGHAFASSPFEYMFFTFF